ncbi:MAG: helix-turn-helix domain-containing protein [Sphingobacterium sp.]
MIFLVIGACHQMLICGLKIWSADELYLVLCLPFGLLFGPAILLLVSSLKSKNIGWQFIFHFIPFVSSLLLFGIVKLKWWILDGFDVDDILLVHLMSFVHFSGYLTYVGLKNQQETGVDPFRLMKRYGVKVYFPIVFIFLLIVEILIMIGHYRNVIIHEVFVLSFFITFLSSLFIFYFTYLRQSEGTDSEELTLNIAVSDALLCKIENIDSNLTSLDKREQLYRRQLEQFIHTKAYLDTELNKEKFSHQLGIPLNNISPFLKKEFGRGFNAFINHLRVNYAAKQLKNTELQTTVDHLSFVCGFNSRASFYRSFQAEFGCTPLQFCKTAS